MENQMDDLITGANLQQDLKSGVELIAEERQRQKDGHLNMIQSIKTVNLQMQQLITL